MWRPFGPTTSSTSASISSCRTPSPTPTLSASSPSFAAPASSPSASSTETGNSSMRSWPAATDPADTVLMAVGPPVLGLPIRTRHGPNRTGRGGRTAAFKFYELRDNLARALDRRQTGTRARRGFLLLRGRRQGGDPLARRGGQSWRSSRATSRRDRYHGAGL